MKTLLTLFAISASLILSGTQASAALTVERVFDLAHRHPHHHHHRHHHHRHPHRFHL